MITTKTSLATGALAALLALAPALAATSPESSQSSSVALPGSAQVDGLPIAELSGLAWDTDEQLLYAVSDLGYLVQFKVETDDDQLTAVKPIHAFKLTDPDDVVESIGERFNAEGLALRHANDGKTGNTELIIALEEDPPTIVRVSPQGVALGSLPVPAPANDMANYRKKGRGLESVVFSDTHGVMTAPESPLLDSARNQHTVYGQDQHWSFQRHDEDSRLKGLALLPDGQLLALERTRAGAKKMQSASLRRVDLHACNDVAGCTAQVVGIMPSGPENFEGLALLAPGQALLVSDNGGKVDTDTVFALVPLPAIIP